MNKGKSDYEPLFGHGLANLLRDIPYDRIVLIGHSMGGLLCQGALAYLYQSNQSHVAQRLRGIILIAVPQLGSWAVPRLLSFLSPDMRALTRHSKFIRMTQQTLKDFQFSGTRDAEGTLPRIDTWGIVANSDFWVKEYSSAANIPSSRICIVRGTHTSLTKPRDSGDDAYRYLTTILYEQLPSASQIELPSASITQLNHAPVVAKNLRTVGALIKASPTNIPWLTDDIDNRELTMTELFEELRSRPSESILLVGEGGTGKTISLIQLFMDPAIRRRGIFWDAEMLKSYLVGELQIPTGYVDKLFLDGLNQALPHFNEEEANRLRHLIESVPAVVATTRSSLVLRADTRAILRDRFTRTYTLAGVRGDILPMLFPDSTEQIEQLFSSTAHDQRVSPLLASMLLITGRDSKRTPETDIAQQYYSLCQHWIAREAGREPSSDEFNQLLDLWSSIAPTFYGRRYGGRENLSMQDLGSSGSQASLASSLLSRGFPDKSFQGFIHPTLNEFFCALGIFRALTDESTHHQLKKTVLIYPNQFEVNVFLRSLLQRLAASPSKVEAAKNRLLSLVGIAMDSQNEVDVNSTWILRNNVFYILGRLPGLSDSPEILQMLFNRESHPLPRYTLLMNALAWSYRPLADMFLEAIMAPEDTKSRQLQDANLFCHLHYYGDIGSLSLPQVGQREWGLTRARLLRHFKDGFEYYRPFWLIDAITVAQLSQRYGGGWQELSMMTEHIEEEISQSDSYEHVVAMGRQVVDYCGQVMT